ncbi:MAG: anti sigma factor C-terminal domain-containing protein [Actinobacteria bacterium]|nr:anti sigma factor C-terminal domain-containing protein [Actinomycetota bacterium]
MEKKSEDTKKDVDKIFDEFKNKKLDRVIKRARWQTILRNIAISFLVFCVFYFAISYLLNASISRRVSAASNYMFEINNISAPNKYMGKIISFYDSFSARIDYTTYKLIQGKVVYTGSEDYNFGFLSHPLISEVSPPILDYNFDSSYLIEYFGYRRYNDFGQRVMVFFYPFVSYDISEYLNDLDLLDDIGNEKYMEIALSFDREYTIEQVEKMLPESVTVTWYWIDDLSENEKEMLKIPLREQEEMEFPVVFPPVKSEYTAYGIKLYYNSGEEIPDPIEGFISIIEMGKTEYKGENEFDRIYNNIAGDDGKLTQDDIRIWGAVVTGDSESLKVLIGLPFIKASSLGVVTDKY